MDSYTVSYVNKGCADKGSSNENPDSNSCVTIKTVVSMDENSKEHNATKIVAKTTKEKESERPQWDNQCSLRRTDGHTYFL